MKRKIRLIPAVLSAVLVATTLSACGNAAPAASAQTSASTESASAAATSSPATTAASPEAQPVALKFITTNVQENAEKDERVKTYFDSIAAFMTANPNVTIEVEAVPHDAYQDKAQILAAANELPDVYDLKGSWTKNFVKNGVVMKLNDYIDANPDWKAAIKPIAYGNFLIDGAIYGLCMDAGGSTTLLYYNEKILKECGIDAVPKTMDELKAAVPKIKAKGYTPISMGNMSNWLAESCYLSAIGSRYTGDEWNTSIVERTGAKFTDESFVKGLALMQDLAKIGAFNEDLNSIDYKQQRIPFMNGKAAMMVEGYWSINTLNADTPKELLPFIHVTGLPDQTDAKVPNYTAGGNGGWAYALNSGLKDTSAEAALQWLRSYISPEYAGRILAKGIPTGVSSDSYDKTGLTPLSQELYRVIDSVPACVTYDLVFEPAVIDVMCKGLQELLIHSVTPEELAARIQEEYEAGAE